MSQLLIGASKRCITPDATLLPNLHGLQNGKFAGVVDDLFVRVIALGNEKDRVLLISFDLDKAPTPAENIPAVVSHTGIPEENIIYIATHTHSAPSTTERPTEALNNAMAVSEEVAKATRQYEAFIRQNMLDAVDEALGSLRAGKIGYNTGMYYGNVNRNRKYSMIGENGEIIETMTQSPNLEGPCDHTVRVVKLADLSGDPVAFLVNYAVHNTAMFRNNFDGEGKMGVSSDMGGNVSKLFEREYPNAVCMWSSGPAGDVNPLPPTQLRRDVRTNGDELRFAPSLQKAYQLLMVQAVSQYCVAKKAADEITEYSTNGDIGCTLEWSKTPSKIPVLPVTPGEPVKYRTGDDVPPYEIRLQALRIGDLGLIGIGGELYTSLGYKMLEAAPMENVVILTHDASLIKDAGYIFDDALVNFPNAFPSNPNGIHATPTPLPGYIADSLAAHTKSMFSKIM